MHQRHCVWHFFPGEKVTDESKFTFQYKREANEQDGFEQLALHKEWICLTDVFKISREIAC